MRTLSLLKGVPVYNEKTGKLLGNVSDICITTTGEVKSLVLDGKGLFSRDRLIPIASIASIGSGGVMVKCNLETLPMVQQNKTTHFISSHHGLFRKPVLSAEGEKLGLLEDVYFQEELGTIIGYELTDGFFADITEGKKVVRTNQPITVGKDVIVVDVKP
ncbi:PRC-barrel domain-containing protein [Cytobacillus sp. S13-E01]|uniref:PRC-barrel domain-containing protein n=1 Tax=Cytobacillus sp. S13-E01 TaxID=3031326 RepID=UPI0023D8000D|nr:PRC-barrel domain-containing protein [Cytobacillus sp. S13-E01]MDF0726820.1 PRC-barrel domain-containing protein [Cytobacillus sp. S13-E01]